MADDPEGIEAAYLILQAPGGWRAVPLRGVDAWGLDSDREDPPPLESDPRKALVQAATREQVRLEAKAAEVEAQARDKAETLRAQAGAWGRVK